MADNRNINPEDRSKHSHPNAEQFTLNLTDEEIGTGVVDMPKRKKPAPQQFQTDAYASQKIYLTEKERKQEEKEHKKRNKIKAGKNKRVFTLVWIAMVVLVSLTFASYLIKGSNDFLAVDRAEGVVEVTIPENVTEAQLAQLLYEKSAIKEPKFFELYCKITANMEYFNAGIFSIESNMDYQEIISTLQSTAETREVVAVTFPEGQSILEIATLIEDNGVCSKDEILEAANNAEMFSEFELVQNIPNKEDKYYLLEGYLFPDTYNFYKGDDAKSVLSKMLVNFQNKISEVQGDIEGSNYNLDQTIILASVIEREAANSSDMFMVSGVLHNRLEWGANQGVYRLECDSTMFYPYRKKADLPEGQENYLSSYNTYEIEGLPKGAICNPGMDAIRAAVKPSADASSYLYFCHSEDGTAYYAATNDEHMYNLELAGLI